MPVPHRYRTIWISDLHLGTRSSKAEGLLDFLTQHEAERYYLVGDIVDGWALQRSWYWPTSHNELLQMLLERAGEAEMIYIPGNHDEAARQFPGLQLGDITIQPNAIHTTAAGQRLLILHGDEFDGVVRHARWLSKIGGVAYQTLLALNRHVNRVRRWMNKPYWSLATAAKTTTKRAVQYIANFEQAVVRRAERERVDGVICGHIHVPELRPIDGITYANTGDWVENCTALVEHMDGRLALRRWTPTPEWAPPSSHDARSAGEGHAGTVAERRLSLGVGDLRRPTCLQLDPRKISSVRAEQSRQSGQSRIAKIARVESTPFSGIPARGRSPNDLFGSTESRVHFFPSEKGVSPS